MAEKRIIADYHLHTKRCKHAKGEMYEYVEAAMAKGIKKIAFTDHIPLPNRFDIAHRMAESELEDYVREIEILRDKYPDIEILCGIEADFYDGFEPYLQQIFSRFSFDLILMSVHFVKGWPKNNWAFSFHFPHRSLKEVYSDYLQAVMRGIKTGLFDVVSHLDLIKVPDQSLLEHNREEVEKILDLCRRFHVAVELNTSGLRKEIGQVYPDLSFLPLIKVAGVSICLGSDAHAPQQVGYRFDEIEQEIVKHSLSWGPQK
ncbi:MAG TPA: histidinol-phosphatase HisJ family protein [Calditrichaeota bacterium]|nr:histidinol-phosphatase HisJ family protein [Calditrichota bacterium]